MVRTMAWTVGWALLVAGAGWGQVVAQPEIDTRLIDLPSHRTVGYGVLEVLFVHRFSQSVQDAGPRDLWGLDSAADVGLGVVFGLARTAQVELYRSSFLKEWEAAFKWTALRQSARAPVGVALRVGGGYRSALGVRDRWTGFVQVAVARRVGSRLDLFLVPGFVSDSPTLRNAVNVGFAAAVHLPHRWDVVVEAVPPNRDARGADPSWALGLEKRVRGHAFLLYLGNSRATTTDLVYGTDIPGGYRARDVRLGFTIVRRFPE